MEPVFVELPVVSLGIVTELTLNSNQIVSLRPIDKEYFTNYSYDISNKSPHLSTNHEDYCRLESIDDSYLVPISYNELKTKLSRSFMVNTV